MEAALLFTKTIGRKPSNLDRKERTGRRHAGGSGGRSLGGEGSEDGGMDGPGADPDARRRALAEIARRRHEQARWLQERIGEMPFEVHTHGTRAPPKCIKQCIINTRA
ncbi:hypothetical protein Vretimale_9017 [Volvox reticuliferus]|uniref:Uncharacterized protein n=1 Tax=Volvox reticuliferus TaxID=1737510 RepID=A0A8J4CRA2_9CHLO|nr:hypothetical protein Vretifemale_14476 [Volvox reticuliferus]GIM04436.1 hypothetical protein Vretimale_9017 [Volvox reticuliferus]